MMCFFFRSQTSDTQSLSFKCDAQCATASVDSHSSCERKKLQVQYSVGLGARWPNVQRPDSFGQSRFEPREELLCCVHGQDT